MIEGFATSSGTARFERRFPELNNDHFRKSIDLTLPSIGLGTYLGASDDATDDLLETATLEVLRRGIHLIDTAIVYRQMRSERTVGRALARLVPSQIAREEVVVSTKGGFFGLDDNSSNPKEEFDRRFVSTGLCRPDDLMGGCHCLAPPFLASQLDRSRRNLGLETIDIYFLHNPEFQLRAVGRDVFRGRIQAAFSFLERAVSEGRIRSYGLATWNAFRVGRDHPEYLPLDEMVRLAESAGGPGHHFRVIQLPVNLAMPEAVRRRNQTPTSGQAETSILEASARRGLAVLTSASIGQGRLAASLAKSEGSRDGNLSTDPQRALQAVRSLPEVSTALVGMKQPSHVGENLLVTRVPVMPPAEARTLFQRSGGDANG